MTKLVKKILVEDCGWCGIGHRHSSVSVTIARRIEYYPRLGHVPNHVQTNQSARGGRDDFCVAS